MVRRAEKQPVSGLWEVLQASVRGFGQALAYKGRDESELARIQIVYGWRHNHCLHGNLTICVTKAGSNPG